MPLPDSVTACRGQNRMLLQSPRCSAILAQAPGRLFLRQKVVSYVRCQEKNHRPSNKLPLLRSHIGSKPLFDGRICTEQETERV